MINTPIASTLCPLCGSANQCAPAVAGSFEAPCWCRNTTVSKQAIARIPADQLGKACLCPRCAAEAEWPPVGKA
ncbi:MAG: cysteine-rich CWC family protein [Pseudomonas sp.]|nr:cysteine-rich CWC family protein [Pseudomonas sp.]